MQTFLPDPDFAVSAATLDNRRLGKQRLEAYQILRTLRGLSSGWRQHPAVAMWRGYEDALGLYLNAMIDEWKRRGFKNTMERITPQGPVQMPPWLGHPALHASHRSNLLRKEPDYYARFGWLEEPNLPYVWPVKGEPAAVPMNVGDGRLSDSLKGDGQSERTAAQPLPQSQITGSARGSAGKSSKR